MSSRGGSSGAAGQSTRSGVSAGLGDSEGEDDGDWRVQDTDGGGGPSRSGSGRLVSVPRRMII